MWLKGQENNRGLPIGVLEEVMNSQKFHNF